MSLEDLRALAEAEEVDAGVVDQKAEEEPEEVEGGEPEADSEESEVDQDTDEASEEYELELDGEPEPGQQKPTPEEAILHKLTKQRKKRQQAESENDALKARLAELEARLNGQPVQQAQATPKEIQYPGIPVLYGKYKGQELNDEASYQRAFQDWWSECRRIDEHNANRGKQESQYRQQIEDKTRKLAERVGKFATQYNMKDDYVVDAVQRATEEIDGSTGIEGSFAHLLDAVGEGGEKAAIYVGSKPDELERVKGLLAEDPTGLKAIAHLTRIATRKPAQRKTSKAPEPDQPLRGDGGTASARKLQAQYDKESDPMKLMRLRKKARELGVKLQ